MHESHIRQAQVDRSCQQIAESYVMLLERYPDQKITISSICDHAEVARQTFYRHFDSKEDIIMHVLNKMWDDFVELLSATDRESITDYDLFLQAFVAWKRYKFLNVMVTSDEMKPRFMKLFRDRWRRVARWYFPESKIDNYDIEFKIAGVSGVFLHWLNRDMAESPEEIATIMYNLISH